MSKNAEYIVTKDAAGKTLTGEKNYMIHLPPGIPASNFWSVIVYDLKTRMIIHTDQPWPSVYSSCSKLMVNQDGSVDVWFGPRSLPGQEYNCILTIRKKHWYMILRLYEPLKAWFDKTWKPGEIEEIK